MILTDYYRLERIAGTKSKMRVNCTHSTASYQPLESLRCSKAIKATDKRDGCSIGSLFFYLGAVPEVFGGDCKRKADMCLTKTHNISSIYQPDITNDFGFGDFRGTKDALLFIFKDAALANGRLQDGASIEIFVARGLAKNRLALYNQLTDGMLDEEIEELRNRAKPEDSILRQQNLPI